MEIFNCPVSPCGSPSPTPTPTTARNGYRNGNGNCDGHGDDVYSPTPTPSVIPGNAYTAAASHTAASAVRYAFNGHFFGDSRSIRESP